MRTKSPHAALVLAWLLVPAAVLATTPGTDVRLTLEQAVSLALSRNEVLLIERESVAAANAGVTAADGAYDPVLEVNGGWAKSIEPVNSSFSGAPAGRLAPKNEISEGNAAVRQLLPTGGRLSVRARGTRGTSDGALVPLSPAYGTQVGVELRQPLLRDRSMDAARLGVRQATADHDGSRAALRRATQETVAAVELAYWRLIAARQAVGVREESVALAATQLVETEARVTTGAAPRTELAQPRAEQERRRGELFAAHEEVARADHALKLLILGGADDAMWATPIEPVEETDTEWAGIDTVAALQQALASRPELKIAEAALRRRRAETAFTKDGVRPSLDAIASYDRYGLAGSLNPASSLRIPAPGGDLGNSFETLGDGNFNAARVGLELSLPITNRSARGDAAAALHVQRQAEVDLARVRKTIRAQVLDAAAALETTRQRIEAARSGREAAEIQLAAERDRYATGRSTNFLVLTRQNELSRARLEEISARTDYRNAHTEMSRANGSLLNQRGVQVDDQVR